MDDEARRVKLKGDLDHSAHTIELRADGTLVAELYDFSDEAEQSLGGDIAWVITVQKEAVPQVVAELRKDSELQDRIRDLSVASDDPMLEILRLLPLRFDCFNDFNDWLDSNHIPYKKVTDTWA